MRFVLVNSALPPMRAAEKWIDDALCRAAGCCCVALGQRGVAAFVIGCRAIYLQTNRISRIVRLGCGRPNRGHHDRQSQNAHQSLLRRLRRYFIRSGPHMLARCLPERPITASSTAACRVLASGFCNSGADICVSDARSSVTLDCEAFFNFPRI